MYDLSDSSLWVGVVTFAAMIPRVLVTPFTGYLADRFDRRRVMAVMFAINLIHNLFLAAVVMLGYATVWNLIILSFVNGSARAAQMPASQALIPNLVPRHLLLNAIALNQATMNGSRLIGPLAILPLLATTGVEGAFLLCSGFYAVSLIQSIRIKTPSRGEINPDQSFTNNMLEGLRYVYRTPALRAIVLMALFHCGLTMSFESLLPVLSTQRLDAESAGFTILMMGVGAGAMIAVVGIAGVQKESVKGKLFLNLGVISGLTPAVLALSTGMPMAVTASVAMGASQAGFMTLTHTMIQAITPDGVRGRVGAVYSVHIGGMMALANLLNGGLADSVNPAMLLLAAGLIFVIIVFVSWRRPTLRRIYTQGLPETSAG